MTPRRAWALLVLAAAGLGMTALAPLAGALVAVAALAALCGLAALQARDTLRESRVVALQEQLAKLQTGLAVDSTRTAEMWREFKRGG